MSKFNTDRYERLKAKIAEECPDYINSLEEYSMRCKKRAMIYGNNYTFEGEEPAITIAHVLRTLGKDYAVNGDGCIMVWEKLLGWSYPLVGYIEENAEVESYNFDLTRDLDGQTDDVKNWLCSIILKD